VPAVENGHCVNIMPSGIRYPHHLQLINVIDLSRCYTLIVTINSMLNESSMIVGFEASDDALVFWLDVHGEVWLEVFNLDVLKVSRNDMAGEVILKEKYFSLLFSKFVIPPLDPLLVELGSHPSLCIISVVEPQLGTGLLVESPWPCCFPNDESWEFLGPIGV
jgi:hypothetical protein